jgi:hypothetical protein
MERLVRLVLDLVGIVDVRAYVNRGYLHRIDSCVEKGGPLDVVFHRSDCHDHETDSRSSWTSLMLLTEFSLSIVAKACESLDIGTVPHADMSQKSGSEGSERTLHCTASGKSRWPWRIHDVLNSLIPPHPKA